MHVAIVGAGPAGAWAAHQLARGGARVTVFDGSHPREKPCGGGITGRALALVAGGVASSEWPSTAIHAARFIDSQHHDEARVPLDNDALVVGSRASFDAALVAAAERAGATVVASRVRDVRCGPGGVEVDCRSRTHRADFLIGADGAGSLVRRRLANAFTREQLSIASGFFAHGSTSHEIVVEMVADPPGYIWSFPRPGHLAIGMCAQADGVANAGPIRARTLDWIRRTRIADGARLVPYAWPIPSLRSHDFASQSIAGPRWCLVGDAAGLVDPITREGIYFSLASGAWAADVLLNATTISSYVERVHDEAVVELTRAARLKASFFRPAFSRLMLGALRQSAAIRAVMADLIAGRQTYAALTWRLLGTLEIGLAWKLLRQRA